MNQAPKITKHAAARRQLDTAIKLFFHEQDSISIHTLTCAAHQILRDLGEESVLKDQMKDMVYEHKRKEWSKMMNEAENFFKHADRDPDKILEFYQHTDYLLWDACQMYQRVTSEKTDLMNIFVTWFFMEHSDILTKPEHRSLAQNLRPKYSSKKEFLQELLPLVQQID
ncbi:hypothetical protein COV82_04180 [Candidatus Peregrinibacteria bacterium CG11_big_fil_rev_8_21_14_0_20_46_8]|nr:MAG: hypothetical protein COV82_04180 [Candidatus Peregrinibacteria bacterium CG11_big_fil_rev_8_21_14_0_20_46_8]